MNCSLCGWALDENAHYCANCGRPVDDNLISQINSSEKSDHANVVSNREFFVPRLGDYLVQSGELTPNDLQRALNHQKMMAFEGSHLTLGQVLLSLDLVDRDVLDQAITQQLTALKNVFKTANQQLERRVEERTAELEKRLVQIRTAAEVTGLAISASDLDELLQRTVDLIVDRFEFYYASLFLLDSTQQSAILSAATGPIGVTLKKKAYQIPLDSQSIVSWVCENNRSRVAGNIDRDEFYLPEELLSETRSEVCVPIAVGNRVLGVVDIQHDQPEAFDLDFIKVLQTIANHIASVIENFRLLDAAQANLNEISLLYNASSRLSKAETSEEVFDLTIETMKGVPFLSVLLLSEVHGMRVRFINNPSNWESQSTKIQAGHVIDFLTVSPLEVAGLFKPGAGYLILDVEESVSFPDALLSIPRQMMCRSLAIIPVLVAGSLRGVLMIGGREQSDLTPAVLQPYVSLTDLVNTALGKVDAMRKMERRLAALQSLNTISQAVSIETDLMNLYKVVHDEIRQIFGDISFLIALYDAEKRTIQVPYMYDGAHQGIFQQPTFHLGEGLVSIVVTSRRPLMIVEDTEEKIRRLGGKMIGKQAKSWLGVPLLMAGEVIGAIVVQDEQYEGRFDEEDQSVLMSLASQVAVGIRNARLLESTHHQAERERYLYEVTSKLRSSTDAQVIIQTMTSELSRALRARRARVEIKIRPEESGISTTEVQEGGSTLPDGHVSVPEENSL